MLPILIMAYRRPIHFRKVIESLMLQEHGDIYVYCDGYRIEHRNDALALRKEVQSYVKRGIIKGALFENSNFGTLYAFKRGLDWFFEMVDAGVILEDDLILSPPLLKVVEEVFSFAQKSTNIEIICLRNTVPKKFLSEPTATLRVSRFISSHGWITTRNRWRNFETHLDYKSSKDINKSIRSKIGIVPWLALKQNLIKDERLQLISPQDANWDIRWSYLHLLKDWHILNLNVNLIEYIGYGQESTHHLRSANANIYNEIDTFNNLNLPNILSIDSKADAFRLRFEMRHTFSRVIVRTIRNLLSAPPAHLYLKTFFLKTLRSKH